MSNKRLSIVVPCYNEQESIALFYQEVLKQTEILSEVEIEFLFMDDGSKDKTLLEIKKLAKLDERVKYISFSRNFGKEAAIYAGLENAIGDYVVLMDVDLQHPPEVLPEMYHAIVEESFDCVATKRIDRKGEPRIRSLFSKLFYKIMKKMCKLNLVDGAQDYRMMTRQVVDEILSMTEYNRFSKGIFSWIGFETKWIPTENKERVAGKTKWSFMALFSYSLDGIFAYSTVPLRIASLIGMLCCLFSFLYICYTVIRTIIWGDPVAGYPTLICAIFFVGGLQLFFLGVLGQYLARTYMETKKRPIYVKKEDNI